jgi:hypothetical protein
MLSSKNTLLVDSVLESTIGEVCLPGGEVDCGRGRLFIGDFMSQNSSCEDGDGERQPTESDRPVT